MYETWIDGDQHFIVQPGSTSGPLTGDLPALFPLTANPPAITWSGGPLPQTLLYQLLHFFQKVDNEYGCEAQARLFYNDQTRDWKALVYPQIGRGLSTQEKEDPTSMVMRDTLKALLPRGYLHAGTIHSHCSVSAFQSGTDEADETRQTGLHITLGFIHKEKFDLHARYVLRGLTYDLTDLTPWFGVSGDVLLQAPATLPEFPENWFTAVEKPAPMTCPAWHSSGWDDSEWFYTDRKQPYQKPRKTKTRLYSPDKKRETALIKALNKATDPKDRCELFNPAHADYEDALDFAEGLKDLLWETELGRYDASLILYQMICYLNTLSGKTDKEVQTILFEL